MSFLAKVSGSHEPKGLEERIKDTRHRVITELKCIIIIIKNNTYYYSLQII